VPHTYATTSGTFHVRQVSAQVDDHRGGIRAEIFDEAGEKVASVQIYCHPDFPGYDACCQLSADSMLASATARLQKYGHDGIVLAESCGASVGMFLNPPGGDAP
jgi:hypothetical protein